MTIIQPKQSQVQINLACPRRHEWASAILTLDWSGPVFADRFCPTCGLPGDRLQVTSADVDGFLNDEQVGKAGREAMPVFAAIYLTLRELPDTEEKRVTFSLEQLCRMVFEPHGKVLQALERLRALGYVTASEIPKSKDKFTTTYDTEAGERRFAVSFGDKVRMVKLTDGAY